MALLPSISRTLLLINLLLIGPSLANATGVAGTEPDPASCTQLLQAQDKQAISACKAQLDEAEKGPATERLPRIVAEDEYGVALLGIGHQPRQALEAFNRAVALLPASTVKPDSLQWAAVFWHRATAYQQLSEWNQAAADLSTAENSLTDAIAAAASNSALTEHFTQLRARVRAQHADILERMGRHNDAQRMRATQ